MAEFKLPLWRKGIGIRSIGVFHAIPKIFQCEKLTLLNGNLDTPPNIPSNPDPNWHPIDTNILTLLLQSYLTNTEYL